MSRIGVLGGTFNPVHIGHLMIAQWAKEKMRLDKVIFVPANLPPHKDVKEVVSSKDRYKMVQLAVGGNSSFSVSDFEIKRQGKSYTIDTMRYFDRCYPKNTKLFFIVGGDMTSQLKNWRYIKDILKIASFIVVNRPGRHRKNTEIKHSPVVMPAIDISSSYLRQRIAQKKTTKYFIPDKVRQYIDQHKLYQTQ
ncbi:MAG: nicotinate-nucleotide adenylyltransferase [Candidatus Omnitrophota bacterium]